MVVLVPPLKGVVNGFELTRALLAERGQVRLVGECATLDANWPAWVPRAKGLLLTELGAYRQRSRFESSAASRTIVRQWLDELHAGLHSFPRPSEVFYGSACLRLFQQSIDAQPFIQGLVEGLAGCEVHCPRDWVGLEALEAGLKASGGSLRRSFDHHERTPRKLRVVSWAAGAAAGVTVDAVRTFARSRRPRRFLAGRRGEEGRRDLWVTLLPTWFRINRHILHSVVGPELESGTQLGTLFFEELGPGTRDEQDLTKVRGAEDFAGLGPHRDALLGAEVDQAVGPATLRELVGGVARGLWRSTIVTARAVRRPELLPPELRSRASDRDIAKLLVVDTFRATNAERASLRVVAHHDFRGVPVVTAANNFVATSAVDAVLRQAGAKSIDFMHGTVGDGLPGVGESPADCRFVWTQADAKVLSEERRSQWIEVAGMPRPLGLNRREHHRGTRVLIMSNYSHRDAAVDGYPFRAAQNELMKLPALLRERVRHQLDFRWRPHPADSPVTVGELHSRLDAVELSRGRPIAEDLTWSDLIVSSASAVVFEAVFADVPLFLHAHPEQWLTPITSFLDPTRVFFYSADVADRISQCLAHLQSGDESAVEPDRAFRARLFGESGEPRTVREGLDRVGCGPASSWGRT